MLPKVQWAGAANLVGRFSSGGAGALAGSYDLTSCQPRGSDRCNIFPPAGLTNPQRPNGAGQLFVGDGDSWRGEGRGGHYRISRHARLVRRLA